jgi:hypothetical protein
VATTLPAGVGPGLGTSPSSSFIPASGYFGGLLSSTATTGPYAATGTTTFIQTGPTTFNATFTSDQLPFLSLPQNNTGNLYNLTLTFGGTPSTTPNSTVIDGNIYGATESATGATLSDSVPGSQSPGTENLYLLSSAAAPAPTSLLAGGTLCTTCTYSQWGYWGGSVTSNFGGSNRLDVGDINFWVAGQPTVTMPTTGTGAYAGSMIGAVSNNGAQYVATGGFSSNYNFGSNTGTFTINNFDNTTITNTTATVTGAGATFGGTFNGAFTGKVSGSFFGPVSGVSGGFPPETGGNFAIGSSSLPYTASGVFLGHR